MALEYGNPRGQQRALKAPAEAAATNQQPATRQANQMGQAPFFQPSAPGGAGPRTPQAAAPQPAAQPSASLATRAMMQPNYAPSSWMTQGPQMGPQNVAGMIQNQGIGKHFQAGAPAATTMQNATGTPQVGTTPYQSGLSTLAAQLAERLANQAQPDTAALKESQKETLNQLRSDNLDSIRQGAGARGTLNSGNTMGQEADLNDAFAGMLTGSYRDIDQEAQQQGFENLLSSTGIAGQLGANEEMRRLQEELGRAGINIDFGQLNLGRDQMNQQGAMFNRQMDLNEAQFDASRDDEFVRLLMQLFG